MHTNLIVVLAFGMLVKCDGGIRNNSILGTTLIGDFCTRSEDCVAPGLSECNFANICSCRGDHVSSSDYRNCLRLCTQLNDNCEELVQCQLGTPGMHSGCLTPNGDGEKVCLCNPNAVNEPGKHICYEKVDYVYDECAVDVQCTSTLGPFSKCVENKCTCVEGEGVPNIGEDACLPIINKIGDECTEQLQCVAGLPGRYSDCVKEYDMSENMEKLVCNCTSDAVFEPGMHVCYLKAGHVGDECTISLQCTPNLGNLSRCSQNKCDCIPNEGVENVDLTRCLPIIDDIGLPCLEKKQCTSGPLGELSDCVPTENDGEKICNCTLTSIYHEQKCHQIASSVGDPCTLDQQCQEGLGELSKCDENVCTCIPGSVSNTEKTKCLAADVLIGNYCEDDAQCVGEPAVNSECTFSRRCACLHGHVASNKRDDCLPIAAGIGDECRERQQCQQGPPGPNSACYFDEAQPGKGICNCTADFVTEPSDHKCYKVASNVGDDCNVEVQCTTKLGYSQCVGNTCSCFDNSVPNTNNTKCLLKAQLNEPCEDNSQCAHLPGLCKAVEDDEEIDSRICACANGYGSPNTNSMCFLLATKIGDSCLENDLQCSSLGGATCIDETKTCDCNHQQEVVSADNTTCLPQLTYLRQECLESLQCSVVGSDCEPVDGADRSECSCKTNEYVESERTENLCLAIVRGIEQNCVENIQCKTGIGKNSECNLGKCQCSHVYQFYRDGCYKPVKLHDICTQNEECFVGVGDLAFCFNDRCLCINGTYELDGRCYPLRKIGDSCITNDDCKHLPGMCDNESKTCSCLDGYLNPSDEFSICYPLALKLGDPCEQHPIQCFDLEGSLCGIVNQTKYVCDCDYEVEVASIDGRRCLEKIISLGEKCEESKQCMTHGSECLLQPMNIFGECRCIHGAFVPSDKDSSKCLEIVTETDAPCLENSQCNAGLGYGSRCENNQCQCNEHYRFYNNYCHIPTQLHDFCESDDQCKVGNGPLSECGDHGRCACLSNATEYNSECYAFRAIGEACEKDVECQASIVDGTERAFCNKTSWSCECLTGFYSDFGNTYCTAGSDRVKQIARAMLLLVVVVLAT